MKSRILRPALLSATVILAAGCAAATTRSNPFSESAGSNEIKLFITNMAFNEATVWAVTNGARRRLGQVIGNRENEFSVPLNHPSELYLEIDILAGPRCWTERIMVDPGDHLELVIRTNNPNLLCRGT